MLKKLTIHSLAIVIAVMLSLTVLVMMMMDHLTQSGPLVIAMFVLLSFGFSGIHNLKGYVFTTMIFSGVSISMYYPQYFQHVGSMKLTILIVPLIQLIMFGMGTSMSMSDFIGVIKTPKAVFIGLAAQFVIMPALGFTLAHISGFAPEIAAGMILIGCSPSGLASNVMNYLAKANLALSITITSISTLLAPLITPILMKFLAGAMVEINVLTMMWDICKMIIIPIGAGLVFNKMFHGKSKWLDAAMPFVSMFGIGFIIIIITAAGRNSLLEIGFLLIGLVLIHNLMGYMLGYWTGRMFKMNEKDCRTIAIEVGMQNGGLASGIANSLGKIATMGLAPAVFGPLMNITGSILASYWHKRNPNDLTTNRTTH